MLQSGGYSRLDDSTRGLMESRFGCDFGSVRIYAEMLQLGQPDQ
ncbi:hypothetical protein Ngar_c07990 [Candidatus Nitrososphaera gargensis Ga9.2]|uniref:Uncharacterized protein n=1 Tax=Nitrososphaera gargensis (strain Ga9.2) TaxID=1237085 RepID=K0I8Z7_NITGG|nr:hypothetical protein Ngar_c07990 [Candidatus Nitrososphaera gargensis Ga9.2]